MSFDVQSAFSVGGIRNVAAPETAAEQAPSPGETMIAFAIATLTILFVSVVGVLMALA